MGLLQQFFNISSFERVYRIFNNCAYAFHCIIFIAELSLNITKLYFLIITHKINFNKNFMCFADVSINFVTARD